jgi:hypothetical protein
MVAASNDVLAAQSVPRLVAEFPEEVEALGRPGTFVDVATRVLKLDSTGRQYLEAIPAPLREAMRAAIFDAMSSGQSVQIHYTPSYDFEVRFSDYGQALSIHIKGPFETDSPGSAYRKQAVRTRSATGKVRRAAPKRKATVRRKASKRGSRRGR